MSLENAVMLALATGAAARMEPNVFRRERPAVAAYQGLVALLEQRYPAVDARLMEIGPGSLERQQLLAQSNAAADGAVLKASQRLLHGARSAAGRAAGDGGHLRRLSNRVRGSRSYQPTSGGKTE